MKSAEDVNLDKMTDEEINRVWEKDIKGTMDCVSYEVESIIHSVRAIQYPHKISVSSPSDDGTYVLEDPDAYCLLDDLVCALEPIVAILDMCHSTSRRIHGEIDKRQKREWKQTNKKYKKHWESIDDAIQLLKTCYGEGE